MAEEYGVRFIPHGWNTALGLAADLQLASASPQTDLVEYLTGSPFIDELLAMRLETRRGRHAADPCGARPRRIPEHGRGREVHRRARMME